MTSRIDNRDTEYIDHLRIFERFKYHHGEYYSFIFIDNFVI